MSKNKDNEVTCKNNALYNLLVSELREIGLNNYKGSCHRGPTSEHELRLIGVIEKYSKLPQKETRNNYVGLCKGLDYFVEIRTSSFVFIEKETGFKSIVEK